MSDISSTAQGSAVGCRRGGEIVEILRDDVGLFTSATASLFDVVDRDSAGKLRRFLDEAAEKSAIFDWEINVVEGSSVSALYFSAARTEGGLLVLIGRSQSDSVRLYNDLARLGNEQANLLRSAMKEVIVQRERLQRDQQQYADLARLNNELVNLQRDLAKKNHELHRMNERQNEFVGWVAHDLRSPISLILGFSELLAEDLEGRVGADELSMVEKIRGLSHFMLGLVNDILSLAQIEAGKLRLHLVETDVGALLANVVALHVHVAERKSISLVLEPMGEAPRCFVDAQKIEQVLNNLISNALKFSLESTTTRVGMRVEPGALVFWVADEGQGIPEPEREQVFLPFQKTSVRSTKGEQSTGLGLTIAKKIVEGHRGHIWLESEVGRGTTFFVRLPTDLREDGSPPTRR